MSGNKTPKEAFEHWWDSGFVSGDPEEKSVAWQAWRAALAETLSIPPAGAVVLWNEGGSGEHRQYRMKEQLPHGTLLYTNPRPQGAKVPSGWNIRIDETGELRIDSPEDNHCIVCRNAAAPDHYPENIIYDLCKALLSDDKEV